MRSFQTRRVKQRTSYAPIFRLFFVDVVRSFIGHWPFFGRVIRFLEGFAYKVSNDSITAIRYKSLFGVSYKSWSFLFTYSYPSILQSFDWDCSSQYLYDSVVYKCITVRKAISNPIQHEAIKVIFAWRLFSFSSSQTAWKKKIFFEEIYKLFRILTNFGRHNFIQPLS